MISSFAPIAAPGARVLILGSMPSVRSLEQRQYYGHERNQFWLLLGDLLDWDEGLPYRERIRMLQLERIALWDVLASCMREGSLDARIQQPVPNDLAGFIEDYPSIQCVFCNGTKAGQLYRRYFSHLPLEMLIMPSTSPAYTLPYEEKKRLWAGLLGALSISD